MAYWLMKSEPDVFGYSDLVRAKREGWDGIRNYQARIFLRSMRKGDQAIFYHSNATPPGAAGVMKIVKEAEPDPTQFDPKSDYHDPASKRDEPRWLMRDLRFVERFARVVTLDELRACPALKAMVALQKGNRLSVTPVTKAEFDAVVRMGK